jgi:putative transcriptional regulator
MKKVAKAKAAAAKARTEWDRFDGMTAKERHAAAMADPDAQPITEEDIASGRMRIVPRVRTLRLMLRLSQEEFAAQFHIPVGTLRDWEQRRKEPDAAARAYLRVIALEPEIVRKALARRSPRPRR